MVDEQSVLHLAEALAKSPLVPQRLRGDVAACAALVSKAIELGVSPLALASQSIPSRRK